MSEAMHKYHGELENTNPLTCAAIYVVEAQRLLLLERRRAVNRKIRLTAQRPAEAAARLAIAVEHLGHAVVVIPKRNGLRGDDTQARQIAKP